MIKFLVLVCCFAAIFAAQVQFNQTLSTVSSYEQQWGYFKKQHGKLYRTALEELKRKEIFRANLKRIESHNALFAQGATTYTLGINEYADLDTAEFHKLMTGVIMPNTSTGATYIPLKNIGPLPKNIDWRTKGYVTEVKNQGSCGACWAFSATGSLEGQHFAKTGKLVSLSEQNLVDCSKKYGNYGCNGGYPNLAFEYVKENKGIDTEASYPYEGKDGICRFKKENVGAIDTGYVKLPVGDEETQKQAVATIGPISVGIHSRNPSFQFYKSGIYNNPDCSKLTDHAVLAIGYGTTSGVDYWLVKNSWGTSWGMEGYVMMSRNKKNQCGIASSSSYPLV